MTCGVQASGIYIVHCCFIFLRGSMLGSSYLEHLRVCTNKKAKEPPLSKREKWRSGITQFNWEVWCSILTGDKGFAIFFLFGKTRNKMLKG